ncbi:hypothetical protein DSM106972_056450 [Dulcicalothrix desertica PCC 7102]|uniref:Uncharacterized protein n=1 Tax=Dulcicalothrix desertica PCC 7102 TaxID=232991 RepID=A0A3S1AJZ2_9CYAN|nr:hypothetical protein [Dulcicalothrix desertica]RUT02725.1 hypothetical protein DSM106972_056450 [Dulcicalothrix desertica PCC 7102]TWH39040.1 hypothetical protein CAL7102_08244 [Dulcicalothrix desertica PCC 7102]
MTNLTVKTLALTESGKNSFELLFKSGLQFNDVDSLESKRKFLGELCRNISERENDAENAKNFTSWTSIASAIFATASLMITPVAIPILGVFTLATVGGSVFKNKLETPVIEILKKYEIALSKAPLDNWAGLWHCTSTDIFLESLYEASTGQLFENKLIGRSVDSWDAALTYCASALRLKPLQILDLIQGKQTVGDAQKTNILTSTANSPKDSFNANNPVCNTDLFANAISIRDSLVNRADDSVLGGCVILAAPGSGKTTFLGTAWGALKQRYGSKFKSLAVVVKKSDIEAFRGVSDKCISVKSGAVTAAVEIIKFIDGSTSHTGNISRLFLDDFLTMQKYLETGTKGKFINPENYAVFDSKKEASEASFDCLPLYEHLMTLLNEYWLVGREYNSAVFVSSHSSNVQDLPFMGSASARSVGDMIFLAKNGKREFIELALGNNFLISDNGKRSLLKSQLDSIDVATDEPIVLGNYNNWTLGVVPSSVYAEYQNYRKLWESNKTTNEPVISETSSDILHDEEFTEEILKPSSQPNHEASHFDYIIKLADAVKGYLIQKELSEVTVEHIRKSRYFMDFTNDGNRLSVQDVREILKLLSLTNFLIEISADTYTISYKG